MPENDLIRIALSADRVDEAVFALRPDYRVALLTVDGIEPLSSDASSDALLEEAEMFARRLLSQQLPG